MFSFNATSLPNMPILLDLPLELIDLIMECLYVIEDWPSLQACCMLARRFVPAARRRLHYSVKISRQNFIRASPEVMVAIAPYTRDLYLRSSYKNFAWLSEVLSTLQLFESLKEFLLTNCIWSKLPDAVETEMLRILQLRNLQHVRIYGVEGLPPTIFWSFTSLRHLEMGSVTLTKPFIEAPTRRVCQLVHLESLGLSVVVGELPMDVASQIEAIGEIMDILLDQSITLDVSRLRVLSIDLDLDSCISHKLNDILLESSPTLECLKIRAPGPSDTRASNQTDTTITLNTMVAPKTLAIVIFFTSDGAVQWLIRILSTLERSRSIQSITLLFILRNHEVITDGLWAKLDTILSRLACASLNTLLIEWSVFPGANDLGQGSRFAKQTLSKLPMVARKKILAVREVQETLNDKFAVD